MALAFTFHNNRYFIDCNYKFFFFSLNSKETTSLISSDLTEKHLLCENADRAVLQKEQCHILGGVGENAYGG